MQGLVDPVLKRMEGKEAKAKMNMVHERSTLDGLVLRENLLGPCTFPLHGQLSVTSMNVENLTLCMQTSEKMDVCHVVWMDLQISPRRLNLVGFASLIMAVIDERHLFGLILFIIIGLG